MVQELDVLHAGQHPQHFVSDVLSLHCMPRWTQSVKLAESWLCKWDGTSHII